MVKILSAMHSELLYYVLTVQLPVLRWRPHMNRNQGGASPASQAPLKQLSTHVEGGLYVDQSSLEEAGMLHGQTVHSGLYHASTLGNRGRISTAICRRHGDVLAS
jgi:hypothetical protein